MFQNQYEIVLVLEYAPGGCFLRVLSRVGHAESASRTYVEYSTIYADNADIDEDTRICMAIPNQDSDSGIETSGHQHWQHQYYDRKFRKTVKSRI